ncbi:Hypothetical predicted protein [Mytilus galloprovincialis]|uniref:Uncharacterized protein n=1 Tax=Mytilus galloprovincialis TaxID=29158 RepID=A0A8B6GFN4_MYTGA|nr:Hypothetical predicted protein [Mytilus galloprovincialis]
MIDSLNFLPSALSKLSKMFGIDELQEGYFPYLFNRQENQYVVLEHLPDIKYYDPDGMKVDDREIFLECKIFLRLETIGIIPAQGNILKEKHSIKALEWLRYVSKSKGIHIQHARNGGEENIEKKLFF